MKKMKIELVWKDRKRHFGLPLSFTVYSLSKDRLFMTTGLLNIRDEEILLYRVSDVSVSRNLGQRLLGVGNVTVMSSDKTMPKMVLTNVKDPVGVKELIHSYVEEMKIQRKVRLGEITTSGDHDCCHDHDDNEGESDFDDD